MPYAWEAGGEEEGGVTAVGACVMAWCPPGCAERLLKGKIRNAKALGVHICTGETAPFSALIGSTAAAAAAAAAPASFPISS